MSRARLDKVRAQCLSVCLSGLVWSGPVCLSVCLCLSVSLSLSLPQVRTCNCLPMHVHYTTGCHKRVRLYFDEYHMLLFSAKHHGCKFGIRIVDVKKLLERSEKVARQRQRLLFGDRDADDLDRDLFQGIHAG